MLILRLLNVDIGKAGTVLPAYRRMGLYVKLRLYSNSWRMCLYVKHFIISGNKKAVTLISACAYK